MIQFLNEFYPYHHLLISIALGLLVGLQREWADSPLAGIRSFALISLLGTMCALLAEIYEPWFIGAGFLGAMVITFVGRFASSEKLDPKQHHGLVTEVSILLMYTIGVLVINRPLLAAAIACLMALLLHVKLELHAMVSRFDKNEIRSIMQFLVITLVILPVLPDKSFGPRDALNLHNIWLMVILIVGISLIGYIIYKFRGEETGILWGGFLGGIISSTATTLSYSRNTKLSKDPLSYNALIILIAWSTLYVRVYIELFIVAPEFDVALPLFIMLLVSGLAVIWSWKHSHLELRGIKLSYNPTGIKTALTFAISYSLIIYVFAFMKDMVGETGLAFVAFISGIMDVDAITLSTGRLINKEILSHQEGFKHFFLAIIANISFKGMIALVVGGRNLFKFLFYPWLLSLLTAGAIIFFKHQYF